MRQSLAHARYCLAFCRKNQGTPLFILSLMALCAAAGVFTAEDRSSVMRSAVMATETATSTPLAWRKMVFYSDFAWRWQRLIVSPFNRVTFITLPAGIGYMCLMRK